MRSISGASAPNNAWDQDFRGMSMPENFRLDVDRLIHRQDVVVTHIVDLPIGAGSLRTPAR